MNKTLIPLLLIASLILAGCGAASATPVSQPYATRSAAGAAPVAPPMPSAMKSAEGLLSFDGGQAQPGEQTSNVQSLPANAAAAEQMIVYTGNLSLVVKDTRAAVDQISQAVKDAGGFVVSSYIYQDEGHARATMTVRVPGEDLAQLKVTLGKIKALAMTVESESLDGQDVTDQYADTQADIENLIAQRDSYRKLLDRATKMEDILNIQTRLDQVQGQINRLTGQQLKIKESVRFSTISIGITPDALAQPIAIGTWRPQGTARNAIQALIWSLQRLGDLLIVAGICGVPMALVIGLPIYLLVRQRRARRRRSTEAAKPQA